MISVFGSKNCNSEVRKELEEAGINVIEWDEKTREDIETNLTGKLGDFSFTRASYYWIVDGKVPLAAAEEMFNTPVGRTDLRVKGNCTCPPPADWASPEWGQLLTYDGQLVTVKYMDYTKTYNLDIENPTYRNVRDDIKSGGYEPELFIFLYQIDSQTALNLFVETIRRYGLINDS